MLTPYFYACSFFILVNYRAPGVEPTYYNLMGTHSVAYEAY